MSVLAVLTEDKPRRHRNGNSIPHRLACEQELQHVWAFASAARATLDGWLRWLGGTVSMPGLLTELQALHLQQYRWSELSQTENPLVLTSIRNTELRITTDEEEAVSVRRQFIVGVVYLFTTGFYFPASFCVLASESVSSPPHRLCPHFFFWWSFVLPW